jgi:hypothetical protein
VAFGGQILHFVFLNPHPWAQNLKRSLATVLGISHDVLLRQINFFSELGKQRNQFGILNGIKVDNFPPPKASTGGFRLKKGKRKRSNGYGIRRQEIPGSMW